MKNKLLFALLLATFLGLNGCASNKPQIVKYSLHLKDNAGVIDPCTGKYSENIGLAINTPLDTIMLPDNNCTDCIFKFETTCGKKIEVKSSQEPQIFIIGDPDLPPKFSHFIKCPQSQCDSCFCRDRGAWQFDIGFAVGSRFISDNAKKDLTYIFTDSTGKEVKRNVPENLLYMFDVDYLFYSVHADKFRFGISSGIWRVDSYTFIPIGAVFKYVSNPHPYPLIFSCNSLGFFHCMSFTIFVGLGVPLDFETKAPVISSNLKFQRFYANAGLGLAFKITRSFDVTADLGLRFMNLPLGKLECCPNLPDEFRYPFRSTFVSFFRLGLSF